MWKIKRVNSGWWLVVRKKTIHYPLITKRGFTLIELLVTTSILGMIAVAIFSTFATGLNVYEKVQAYSSVQADVLLSFEKMERDLRSVFKFSRIDFVGDTKKITFAGLTRKQETGFRGQIGKISYYFDKETNALVKEEQDYPYAISESGGKCSFEILAFVKSINFSYYYFDPETQSYGWKSSWSTGDGIPRGVKIKTAFEDGGKNATLVRTVFIPVAG